jgi:hypothetical protein
MCCACAERLISSCWCRPGSLLRDTEACHTIKEKHEDLVGQKWAALNNVNLTSLGVRNYRQLFQKQVPLLQPSLPTVYKSRMGSKSKGAQVRVHPNCCC